MIKYALEILVFQFSFLLIYELMLKKETFFQWNRFYLLLTFAVSLILPFIKIEALKTTISTQVAYYHNFWWDINNGVTINSQTGSVSSFLEVFTIYGWIFLLGATIMGFRFVRKIMGIQMLRKRGVVTYHSNFTKIEVKQSSLVFSFFKQVFVGDAISKEKETHILAHELVHIKQWHSLDLLFFELMRIAFWFNPFVYIYQSRIATLHEFIADAEVAQTHKKEQYQTLLSETFQTQNISFVNQFFKESLIKKRIVMLAKQKSNQVKLVKYLGILPLLLTMVVYTSCESEGKKEEVPEATKLNVKPESGLVAFMQVEEVPVFPGCENSEDSRSCFLEKIQKHIRKHFNYPQEAQNLGIEGQVAVLFTIDEKGQITNIQKRGPHPLLENEVERIIKRLPKMEPGTHNGELVKVPFSIPVNFVLQDK